LIKEIEPYQVRELENRELIPKGLILLKIKMENIPKESPKL